MARRRRVTRRGRAGVSTVEFAIMGPLGFLLLLGIVILGLLEMNQVQLSNLTRDSARAGAICGGADRILSTNQPKLPNGQTCTYANFQAYVTSQLNGLTSGSVSKPATGGFSSNNCDLTASNAVYCVWQPTNGTRTAVSIPTGSNPLDACRKANGDEIEVVTQFSENLYIPMLGNLVGGSGNTKSLVADAYAACEQ